MSALDKIAIVEPVGGHGGMNYYDYGLGLGLANAGMDVTLYTCDKTEIEHESQISTQLCYEGIWGKSNKLIRLFRYLKGSRRALKHAKAKGINTVHFHFFDVRILESYNVKLFAKHNFKIVVTVHDIESFESGNSSKSLVQLDQYIDHYIVHNKTSKKLFLDTFNFPAEKVSIIPHGNYIDTIDSNSATLKQPNLQDDDFCLLFFGQIKEVKGLDVLLKALAIRKIELSNVRLVVVGKVWQDDFSKYEQIINDLQLEEHIILNIEYIPDSQVASYYKRAQLVVLPYKRIYQSGVLLMAMSYGKAVLASDLDAMKDTIRDGENAFLFESENEDHLAERILELSKNKELLEQVGQQAYSDMKENYSWNQIGIATKERYLNL